MTATLHVVLRLLVIVSILAAWPGGILLLHAAGIVQLICHSAELAQYERLTRRIPDDRLARMFHLLVWLIPVVYLAAYTLAYFILSTSAAAFPVTFTWGGPIVPSLVGSANILPAVLAGAVLTGVPVVMTVLQGWAVLRFRKALPPCTAPAPIATPTPMPPPPA